MIISKVINRFNFWRKKVSYEEYPLIRGVIRIHGNGKVIIGKRVKINSSERSNPIGGMEYCVFSSYENGKIIIGNDVGISNSAFVSRASITIEDGVKIGGSVKIYDTDFHSKDSYARKDSNRDKPEIAPIVIGKNAFIGAHSIVLKGVTIGENSIIGAGSVVAKDIPANEIWAGNPVKFIKIIGEKDNENIMDV